MIRTLHLLLMPIYILLIFPTNFSINLQQYTKYSATINSKFQFNTYIYNLRFCLYNAIIQYTLNCNELLRFHYRMAASKPTFYKKTNTTLYLVLIKNFNFRSGLFPF